MRGDVESGCPHCPTVVSVEWRGDALAPALLVLADASEPDRCICVRLCG
jgi:hypothetical protein